MLINILGRNMRRFIFLILSFAMLAFTLGSCAKGGGNAEKGEFSLVGTVKEIDEKILVEIEQSDYMSGDMLLIVSKNTVVKNSSGDTISISDIKVGDKISASYNGQVMMSYPAQVSALEITVITKGGN